jgi:hypothetical protein
MRRAKIVYVLTALTATFATAANAQVTGMPLFTNPRVTTGVRVHADIGQPTGSGTQPGNLTVIQGGVTLGLGPVGIGANVGALRNDIKNLQGCSSSTLTGCNPQTKVTGSALVQLKLMGGGLIPLSLSVFGGASTDFSGFDAASLPAAVPQSLKDSLKTKEVTIPVGAAIGLHVPLLFTSLNLWGAPRINFHKFINCGTTNPQMCSSTTNALRWAAGVDIPLLPILSIRAAYDSGKLAGQTVNDWGVGVSVGLGGMR